MVVYVDGGFDLFHVGHIEFLRAAKAKGTYLLVGIHSDEDIHAHKGANFPIMTLQERVLGVLSCRYVDEVIIGAPYSLTGDLIDSLKVNVVCSGVVGCEDPDDSYSAARERGIHAVVESGLTLTSTEVIERILSNYARMSNLSLSLFFLCVFSFSFFLIILKVMPSAIERKSKRKSMR